MAPLAMNDSVSGERGSRWGLILAGGEGSRLRAVTERLGGKGCPKQFCRLLGEKTLYEQTEDRARHLLPNDQIVPVVTRCQAGFYPTRLLAHSQDRIVIQPESKGTSSAIFYGLLRVQALDPDATVVVLPSDHFVSDDAQFMDFVAKAFEVVGSVPDQVVLLGIEASAPETGYGWIEPGRASEGEPGYAVPVARFWEKPSRETALKLWQRGCLWNAFVLVARASWLLQVITRRCPELARQFAQLRSCIGSEHETSVAERTYRGLPEYDFSRDVLMAADAPLGVIAVNGVGWSDLGDPQRLAALTAASGRILEKQRRRRLSSDRRWREPAVRQSREVTKHGE